MENEKRVDFYSCRIASIVTLLLSAIMNLIVIVSTIMKKQRRQKARIFFVSLCLIDMIFATIMMTSLINVALKKSYEDHNSSLKTTAIIHCVVLTASLIQEGHLLVIAFERFYATWQPMRYREVFTPLKKRKILVAVWSLPFIIASTIAVISYKARFARLVPISMAAPLVFTAIATSILYTKMYRLRKSARIHVSTNVGDLRKQKETEKHLVKASLKVVLTYFICNTPVTVFLFLADIQNIPCHTSLGVGTTVAVMFVGVNLILDPLIYFWHIPRRAKKQESVPEAATDDTTAV